MINYSIMPDYHVLNLVQSSVVTLLRKMFCNLSRETKT